MSYKNLQNSLKILRKKYIQYSKMTSINYITLSSLTLFLYKNIYFLLNQQKNFNAFKNTPSRPII